MANAGYINSVDDFLKKVFALQEKNKDKILLYRGFGNEKYDYKPTAFRNDVKKDDEYFQYENSIVEYPEEFNRKDHLSYLVKMRHYGAATRVLDFSRNPLISLYFACEEYADNVDAKISIIIIDKNEMLSYASDKALMLSCLSCFKDEDKEKLKNFFRCHTGCLENVTNPPHVFKRFLHEIQREFPAFKNEIIGEDVLNSYFVSPKKDNERMKVQDGVMYIYGLDVENGEKYLKQNAIEYHIRSKDKKKIIEELKILRISQVNVYPGLERGMLKANHRYLFSKVYK